ncbi:MAG: hypothetical protein JW974_00600 [Alphaproteobacteria bacterium]|nr:hypothetical protein [Alphaproteobacteria bacterium]MBN2675248.1 hypothetical protein [Alphaproteobacteria bacterium]
MKLIKKIFLTFILSTLVVPSFAAGKKKSDMKAFWGNPPMSHCLGQSLGDACVGNSLSGCKNWVGTKKDQANRGTFDDEMATLLLLARDVNENGAKFCVTQAQGANKNKGNAWTQYYNPAGNMAKCFWLCKPGHSGEGCTGDDSTTCDSTLIKKSDFSGYKITKSGPSVESTIVMFNWDEYKGCGLNAGQEHDMVLGISGWLQSGHGAFARPMVVRSQRDGWKDMVSTATIWGVGEETLLCKDGYEPNATKTDCIAINNTLCSMNTLCTGWDKAKFAEEFHDLTAKGSCFEYRCKVAGMAFTSATDKTCIECSGDARVGVPESTGVCIKCPAGKIFDNKATTTGFCKNSVKFTTQDLTFGPKKDKNSALETQCWTKIEPTEYKNCVLDKKETLTTEDPVVDEENPVVDKPVIKTVNPKILKKNDNEVMQ